MGKDSRDRRLSRLDLENFKGFKSYGIDFGRKAILVGPNNAGKSTIIAALRSGALMLRHARSRNPSTNIETGIDVNRGYRIDAVRVGLDDPNIKYDLQEDVETSAKLTFQGGSSVTAVWPGGDVGFPGFYLSLDGLRQPRNTVEVRNTFPLIGVLPVLGPLDPEEKLLDDRYVKGELASWSPRRHFRNHMWLLSRGQLTGEDNGFRHLLDFMAQWCPEIRINVPILDSNLLVLTVEEGERPKEVSWIGDGLQVWLQLLLRLFLVSNSDIVVLDEPDVYLHADLQQRLMRLIDTMDVQVILATHSTEMLAEVEPGSIIWVDRLRTRPVTTSKDVRLQEVSRSLGSVFNLRMAKVLRSRLALFVEGDDLRLLSHYARVSGAEWLATDEGVRIVPMGGATRTPLLEAFDRLIRRFLQEEIPGYVLLDRDLRSAEHVQELIEALGGTGLHVRVWSRHELENYLFELPLLARSTKLSAEVVQALLDVALQNVKPAFLPQMMSNESHRRANRGRDPGTLAAECQSRLDEIWSDPTERLMQAPGKELLARFNEGVQRAGGRARGAAGVARYLLADDLAPEVSELMAAIERSLHA